MKIQPNFIILVAVGAIATVGAPHGTLAHSYKLDDISVGHVWAPPPDEADGGVAVYGPLLNRGDATAELIGASSPIAETVRFRAVRDGKKSWKETIPLAPNMPVALAPWREHIWLSGVRVPLENGDIIKLNLDFGKAGELPVEVVVENAGEHGTGKE